MMARGNSYQEVGDIYQEVRFHEILKPRDLSLVLSGRSQIWQS